MSKRVHRPLWPDRDTSVRTRVHVVQHGQDGVGVTQLGRMKQRSGDDQSFTSNLLGYFHQPREPMFNDLTYTDFCTQCCFEPWKLDRPLGPSKWPIRHTRTRRGLRRKALRQQQTRPRVVARMHLVPARIGELFYVRILLQPRPAFIFEDLRTIHGRVNTTYQEAATASGLFEDESEPCVA
jgi:hypothetical protein